MPIYNKNELGRVAQEHGFVRDTKDIWNHKVINYQVHPDSCIV